MRQLTARVIERLAEVIRRDWHLERGYPSVTEYCVGVLGYTHDQGCRRAAAARLSLRYPVVPELIRNGDISFTILQVLSPVLKAPEDEAMLFAARGKTRFEVEQMVATKDPKALFRGSVRPLDGEHFELRAPISAEAQAALVRLQEIDRHAIPDADIGEIVSRAIIERLEKVEARKFAKLKRPKQAERNAPVQTDDGSSPNAPVQTSAVEPLKRAPTRGVTREISERDGCQCCYEAADGTRCQSRAWPEREHRVDHADGGAATVANMRIFCRAHNQWKAKQRWGPR